MKAKRFLLFFAALIALGIGVYLLWRCWATPWLVWFSLSALFTALAVRRPKIALAFLSVVLLTLLLYNGVLAGQDCSCYNCCPKGYCCHGGICRPKSDPVCGGGGGDQPPSITGTVLCDQWGNSPWCRSNARLRLTASDPQGYSVTITGDLNGAPFNCGTTNSCTLSLPPGTGTAHYTATASNSGLTASGSTTWAYDPTPPTLTDTIISGTAGLNGWYVSTVTDQASASDSISGVSPVMHRVNGGRTWDAGNTVFLNADGIYTVDFWVADLAGNETSLSRTIKVDRTPPTFTTSTSGTAGNSPWYVSPATTTISANDATSGIGSVQYNQNGAGWQSGSTIVSSDGVNAIDIRVMDKAGNVSSGSLTVYVDTTPPTLTDTVTGTAGNSPWYLSPVTVDISGSDATSGVASVALNVDGALSSPPVTLNEGVHTVSATAADNAGNTSTLERTIYVDTTPPAFSFSPSGTPGNNGWYVSDVLLSILASDAASGVASIKNNDNGAGWSVGGSVTLHDGQHTVQTRVTDNAGNATTHSTQINVDTTPPVLELVLNGAQESGRYITEVMAQLFVKDETSGVARTLVTQDGNVIILPAVISQGAHNVYYEAEDVAGNMTSSVQVVTVALPITPTPQPTEAPKLVFVLPTIFSVPTTQPAPTPTLPLVQPATVIPVTPEPTRPAPQPGAFAPLTVSALLLFGASSLLLDPRPTAWRRIVRSAQPYMMQRYDDD